MPKYTPLGVAIFAVLFSLYNLYSPVISEDNPPHRQTYQALVLNADRFPAREITPDVIEPVTYPEALVYEEPPPPPPQPAQPAQSAQPVVYAASAPSAPVTSGVEQWRGLVASIFPAESVDHVLRIMACESGGNPNATGSAGERGLMQIHPIHADSTYDPEGNIRAALRISGGYNFAAWSCK